MSNNTITINHDMVVEVLDKDSLFLHEHFATITDDDGEKIEVNLTIPHRSIVIEMQGQRYHIATGEYLKAMVKGIQEAVSDGH